MEAVWEEGEEEEAEEDDEEEEEAMFDVQRVVMGGSAREGARAALQKRAQGCWKRAREGGVAAAGRARVE